MRFQWALDEARALENGHFRLIERVAMMDCYPHCWGDLAQLAADVFKQGSRINGYRVI